MSKNIWDELNIKQASDREQQETALAQFSATLNLFKKALLAEGFTQQEALYLLGQWMTSLIGGKKP